MKNQNQDSTVMGGLSSTPTLLKSGGSVPWTEEMMQVFNRRYRAKLVRFVQRHYPPFREDAEDCVQDLLLFISQRFDKLERDADVKLRPVVMTIFKDQLSKRWKKQKRRQLTVLLFLNHKAVFWKPNAYLEALENAADLIEEDFVGNPLTDEAKDVYGLTERNRWCHIMVYEEGLSQKEVARKINRSESVVSEDLTKVENYLSAKANERMRKYGYEGF